MLLWQCLLKFLRYSRLCILVNRMQFAGKGTLEIVYELLKAEHTENIGIVLGMNEQQRLPEYMLPGWESVTEELDNNVAIFRIGNAGESGNKEMRLLQQKVLQMISEHCRILFFSWILNRRCFIWKK